MLDNDIEIETFKKHTEANNISIEKIKTFIEILDIYQNKMNLIGKNTRISIWDRHILDSAQIQKYLHKENKKKITIDVGTGAGFPGVILSIMGRKDMLLCEKSKKKVKFLKTVAAELSLKIKIFEGNIEDFKTNNVQTIVSRAFLPLKKMMIKVRHLVRKDTVLVLHKGEKYLEEIKEAKEMFSFNHMYYRSLTNSSSRILKIKNLEKMYARN